MTSWANIVRANISQEYLHKIDEEHNKRIEDQRLKKLKNNLEYFIKILKKERHEFWYFYVGVELEKKIDERYKWNYFIRTYIKNHKEFNDEVNALQEDKQNQKMFTRYLRETYGDKWLGCSKYDNDKPYDCEFIYKLRDDYTECRYQEELEYDGKIKQWGKEIDERLNAEEKKEETMMERLKNGKITPERYNKWVEKKRNQEMEKDEAYHCLGASIREGAIFY
jgi:hypothetical protein